MQNDMNKVIKKHLSLILLFIPAVLFVLLLFIFRENSELHLAHYFPYLPWQFLVIALFGVIATIGGILNWRFHRNPLNMKIPKRERDAEAMALGFGGVSMFVLMWFAMMSIKPSNFLIPILIILIYTVVAISYDEFVFHMKRCENQHYN